MEENKGVGVRVYKKGESSSGAIYGLGFIGAMVYFIMHATNLTDGLAGVLKALVWPAYLVYYALKYFGL